MSLDDFHPAFVSSMHAQGYESLCVRGEAGLCAVKQFNFTWGLVVKMDPAGYERRYCFERREEAMAALAAWDGVGHPGGPWIKCKGAQVDLLNPSFGLLVS